MNNLMKITASLALAILSGCVGSINTGDIGTEGSNPNGSNTPNNSNTINDNFFTRAETLPSNFTNRAVAIIMAKTDEDTQVGQLETVANEYRTSVIGEPSIVDRTGWYLLFGDRTLTPESGVFMVHSEFISNGNVVVGIFDTTDVGPAFTEANPTAAFDGLYGVKVISTLLARDYEELGAPITLTADFGAKTLRGGGSGDSGAILTVSGKFNGTTLSGSVNFSPFNANRSFDAPLTGFVGQNGAVGAFASSANDSDSDYAFGGGFVVSR